MDEARRLAVVSAIPNPKDTKESKTKLSKTEIDVEDTEKSSGKENTEFDSETVPNDDEKRCEDSTQTDNGVTQPPSLKKTESVEHEKQLDVLRLFQEDTMHQIKELKVSFPLS